MQELPGGSAEFSPATHKQSKVSKAAGFCKKRFLGLTWLSRCPDAA